MNSKGDLFNNSSINTTLHPLVIPAFATHELVNELAGAQHPSLHWMSKSKLKSPAVESFQQMRPACIEIAGLELLPRNV